MSRARKTVLGKRYPDTGVEQGRAVLADLARHPATAQHIAQKLARHFVADEPPPSLVAKLANDVQRHWRRSEGSRQDAGHRRRIVDAAARQAQSPALMDRRRAAPDRRTAQHHPDRPRAGRASHARRGAVAAAGAERLSRYRSGLDRRHAAPARYRQRVCRPRSRRNADPLALLLDSASAPSPRPRRAIPSRARKAAPRPWRSSSCRRNSCGADHENVPCTRRGAKCCLPPARCSPGPICRNSRLAEGRDPRFLTIVLRGALDGLATVAPVGDPDWIALRGDNALDAAKARRRRSSSTISSRSIRRCRTCIACSPPTRRSSCTPAPRRTASARISTARIFWKAACPSRRRATAAGSIARSPAWRPAAASIRKAARRSRSDR